MEQNGQTKLPHPVVSISFNEGRLRKQIIYFNSFYGLRLVNFRSILVIIFDSQGRSAFVAFVYKNKLLAKEIDR